MTSAATFIPPRRRGEPPWEIATLYPEQGSWSEEEYLALDTNHLVEFADGVVEVLPMPKMSHQLIVQFLHNLLYSFVMSRKLGMVLFAGLRVRLRPNLIREPDIVFMAADHMDRAGEDYWTAADLVMEVVSPDPGSRDRDHVQKRREYAKAGIPEYWIIDPQERRITVLKLQGSDYIVDGEYEMGHEARSATLTGFSANVSDIFAAGERKTK